ncbi:UNVERIFIED_CONTAM: hypothetical protein Sradi_5647100 [Sesamum radiatum]|uniref:Uncharacterized protein n=1 Tax=Sesamum radiatum TaxID=300843 RepID=A0AAW2L1H4_SESRA
MVRKRGSKRRRMNQDERKEEEEEERTTGGGVDEGGEKSVEKSEKIPVVVFAHGAGAPSSSDWMVR